MKSSPILYVHYVNSHGHEGPLQSQLMKSSPILYVHYVNSHGHDGPLQSQLMKSSLYYMYTTLTVTATTAPYKAN